MVYTKLEHFKSITREQILERLKKGRYQNLDFLAYANISIRNDQDFFKTILKINTNLIQCAGEAIKDNEEIIYSCIREAGWNMAHASERIKSDKNIIAKWFILTPFILEYISPELKRDREYILNILLNANSQRKKKYSYGFVLEFLPEFKSDLEIVNLCVADDIYSVAFSIYNDDEKYMRKLLITDKRSSVSLFKCASERLQTYYATISEQYGIPYYKVMLLLNSHEDIDKMNILRWTKDCYLNFK